MNAIRRFSLGAMIALSCGCATEGRYQKKLDSWNGSHVDKLVDAWGAPQSTFKKSNGETLYTWAQSSQGIYSIPNYNAQSGITTYSVNSVNSSCTTSATADENGIIQRWRFEGNACKAGINTLSAWGWGIFGGSYLTTVAVGAALNAPGALYVPMIGPALALPDTQSRYKGLTVLSGVTQVVGVAMIVSGYLLEDADESRATERTPRLQPAMTSRGEPVLALSYQF